MVKAIAVATLCLCTVAAAAAAPTQPPAMPAASPTPLALDQVFTDPAVVIRAHVGQTFLIALASNRTTGYSWQRTGSPDPAVETVGDAYQAPRAPQIGAGGQEVWIFRAIDAGIGSVTLQYVRPFDKSSAVNATSVTFHIEVAP
jgi:inhibitor of cysteine peptidase